MKIEQIKIKNFGIVQDEITLTPQKGINLITGVNGSGKSTFYKAVILMLFNKTDKKLEEYVNESVDLATGFNLSMDFTHNKERYRIEYSFQKKGKSGTSHRKLYVGDPLPDEPQYMGTDAVVMLEELFDPNIGLAGMVARQGENDVITAKPAERREHFKAIHDLNFTDEITSIEADIEEYEKKIIPEIDQKIYHLESMSYELEEKETPPFSSQKYDEYLKKRDEMTVKIQAAEQHEAQIARLEDTVESQKESLEAAQESIDFQTAQKEKYTDRIAKLEDEIANPDHSKLDELEASLADDSDYLEKKERTEQKLAEIKLPRVKKFDYEALDEKKTELATLKAKRSQVEEQLDLVQQGKCPTCGRPFEEHSAGDHEEELSNLNSRIKEIKSQIDALSLERDEYEQMVEEVRERKAEKEQLQQKLETLAEREEDRKSNLKERIVDEKENTTCEISNKRDRVKDLRESLEEAEKAISRAAKQADTSRFELSKAKKALAELRDVDQDDLEDLHTAQKLLDGRLAEYQRVEHHNKGVEERNKKTELQKKGNEQELKTLSEERDERYREKANFEEARNVLRKEFPSFVISELVKGLENGINKFVEDVYYKPLNISIQEKRNSIDITYGVGRKKDVVHLSGAEQQLVSLAYKSYLNRMIGLGVVMLDEADAHYTDENAERLYEIILGMEEQFSQIFIISHNEKAKDRLAGEHDACYVRFSNGRLVESN